MNMKSLYGDKTSNGYVWRFFEGGIHTFTRKEDRGFSIIRCSTEQIENGDIDYMTEHGLTLGRKEQIAIRAKYRKSLTTA